MVQRPPPDSPWVRKRDGRLVPFAAAKLAASIDGALTASGLRDPGRAQDLADVVATSLSGPIVDSSTIAARVLQVLDGAHCPSAARLYGAALEPGAAPGQGLRIRGTAPRDPVRAIPPASGGPADGAGGRVARLLETEAAVAPDLARDIAAEVERSVLASGLPSVSPALLREWIDNALQLRGLPARLGQHQVVGLAGHELREVLASGNPGAAAESEVAGRLLSDYALREVFPAEVAQAHESGLLGLEHLTLAGRVESLVVAPWKLPVVAAHRARRARLRALGPVLRNLVRLCSDELVLVWDGPALSVPAATDLLVSLSEPSLAARSVSSAVLAAPRDSPDVATSFLDALEVLATDSLGAGARPPAVRFDITGWGRALLRRAVRAELVDGRLQFAVGRPQPRIVGTSVALNLARAALVAGRRKIGAFLDGVESATLHAVSALSARDALMSPAPPPMDALADATGLAVRSLGPVRARMALSGWSAACTLLVGDGPAARDKWPDLAAAVGERITRCLGAASVHVIFGWAGGETRARFGRLDMRAFPQARDLLALTPARDAFRYDGLEVVEPGTDPAQAGRKAAHLRQLLGIDDAAPVPRSTGGTNDRLAFLTGFLSESAQRGMVSTCA